LRNDCPAPYIISKNENAYRIINGDISDQKFLIGIDDIGSERLIKKTEYLRLKQKENALYLLPKKKKTDWDLRARLFLKNHKLVFEINKKRIKRLVAQSIKRQIKLNSQVDLEFYLTRKNYPDYLLDTIQIDADELIKKGQMVFEADSGIVFDDISILTQRQFKNYYFEVLDDEFIDDHPLDNANAHIWRFAGGFRKPHIQITQKNDIVTIKSLVDSVKLDQVGIHELNMNFYVVGESPDHYIDHFGVDMSRLRVGQSEKFQVNFDIEEVDLMYLHPSLRINKRKEL